MNQSGNSANSLHYVRPNPPIVAPTQNQNPPRPTHYHEPWSLVSNGRIPNAAANHGQIVLPPTSQARQSVSPDSGYRSIPSSSSDYQIPSPQSTTAPSSLPSASSYKTTQSNHISANQIPSAQTPVIPKSKTSEEIASKLTQQPSTSQTPPPKSLYRSLPISASEYQFTKQMHQNSKTLSQVPVSKSFHNGFRSLPTSTNNEYKVPILQNLLPTTSSPSSIASNFLNRLTISNSEHQILSSKAFINNYRMIASQVPSNNVPHSKSFPNGYNSLPSPNSSDYNKNPSSISSNLASITDGYKSLPSPTSSSSTSCNYQVNSTNHVITTSSIRENLTTSSSTSNTNRRLSLPNSPSLPLLLRGPRTSSTFHGSPLQPPPPPAPSEPGTSTPPRRPTSIYLKGGSFHLPSTAVPPTSPWPGSMCPPPPPTPRNGYQVVDHKVSLFLEIMDSQERFSKVSWY